MTTARVADEVEGAGRVVDGIRGGKVDYSGDEGMMREGGGGSAHGRQVCGPHD